MKKHRPLHKKIRDQLFYLLVLIMIKLLRLMPRKPAVKLLRMLGAIIFHLGGSTRRKTVKHLTLAFGHEKTEQEIIQIARNNFIHLFGAAADFFRLPCLLKNEFNGLITTEGLHHLEQAWAEGKGVMMLTAHFGNWELLAAWLAWNGYPMKGVGTSLFDPRLDKLVVETRTKAGITNIARGKATREIMRTLKEGGAIGMLIDQDTKVKSTFVNFFGYPASTPTGPTLLARKFKIPIIPIFIHMREDLTYHIEGFPPITQEYSDNEERDITINTQRCTDLYEQVIRRHPAQWVWMHKRWHRKPTPNIS
ncbi:MAG: lysophospholipid acyltransferase family protein [Proteobacteria bacterium]|nr:lysophospholipid acyltransferase family protein [Pseudomonadota bacterium]MBU1716747.1 lysophospholipid acyltransferase family protein [Pseudomonadota bacterium]